MYIIALILWNINLAPTPDFTVWAVRILTKSAIGQSPVRLVWNQQIAPSEIESQLLAEGVVLTTVVSAARIEVVTDESLSGDIFMSVRVMDVNGTLVSSERYVYQKKMSRWRRAFDRFANPVMVTAATGLTIYLLYNVRSR